MYTHIYIYITTSLCGVLAFYSVSRSRSSSSASSLSHTTCSHTTLSHTIFQHKLHTTCSHTHTTLSHTIFQHKLCHNYVTHHLLTQASHNLLTHTHTTLSYTIFHHKLCHNFVTHTHTLSFTHNLLTHKFVRHHLSHTTSFTHNFVTHHLCVVVGWVWWRAWEPVGCPRRHGTLRGRHGTWRHPPAFCVAGAALMALGWVWWRLVARGAAALCVAGVALGDIHPHFAWQAWHLATSTCTLRGRRSNGLGLVTRLGPFSRPGRRGTLRGRRGTW